jgi:hypothetical protein
MKKSPQQRKLERLLQSSKFSASGFMGTDRRSLWEIIDEDAAEIAKRGKTMEQVAQRMQQLTDLAKHGLGDWIHISKNVHVLIDDHRGMIPCPWPHQVRCLKRITTARHIPSNSVVRWSDLNIHLINEHGFFEGKGSPFRIEPDMLMDIIFSKD